MACAKVVARSIGCKSVPTKPIVDQVGRVVQVTSLVSPAEIVICSGQGHQFFVLMGDRLVDLLRMAGRHGIVGSVDENEDRFRHSGRGIGRVNLCGIE